MYLQNQNKMHVNFVFIEANEEKKEKKKNSTIHLFRILIVNFTIFYFLVQQMVK